MDERWARERETQHPAEAWFFSFPSVASSKAVRSEYDNLFRGERALPKEAFHCGNPTGPEVGISRRTLTLLPDEKELNSQPPVVVPLTGEALLRMFLPSKHYGIKMTDFVRFILILYSSIFGEHAPQSIRIAYDSLSISRLDTRIFTAVSRGSVGNLRE